MEYVITSQRLKSVFNHYMDEFTLQINDLDGDLTVFIEGGERIFDTFDDHLAVNPKFWEKLQGLFGESMESLLIDWFNETFTWNVKTTDADWDFYGYEEDEEY